MRRHTKIALGIDISERRVSLALVEKEGSDFRVLAGATSHQASAEPGRGPATGAEMLGRALTQLGRHGRWRGLRTALAFTSKTTILQVLDLPRQAPTNMSQFVEQELRQYVALSGRDMLSDFCGIGTGPGLAKRLLVVGTDAGQVREMVRACRTAGLSVEAVEPAALACATTVLRDPKQAERRDHVLIGLLDTGRLTVCLFRKGTLELVRVRDVPADANVGESLARWLAGELQAVLTYGGGETLARRDPGRTVVLVQDIGCPAPEFQRCLAAEAQMEQVTVVDACDSGCLPGGAKGKAGIPAPPEASLAAFGAAARLLDREADGLRVNLLPEEVTRARMVTRRLLVAANVAAWVFLTLLVLVQIVARTTGAKRARIQETRLSRELYATPALMAQERFVASEIARIEQDLRRLETIRVRRRVNWPGVLQAARRAVPAEVSLAQLTSPDGRSLSLQGQAPSCAAAQQFVRNLDGRDPFTAVALTRLERRQEGANLIEYQIECSLEPVP
jgi:Tfp pilus assembly protein PilN